MGKTRRPVSYTLSVDIQVEIVRRELKMGATVTEEVNFLIYYQTGETWSTGEQGMTVLSRVLKMA